MSTTDKTGKRSTSGQSPAPKVVGPNVQGQKEEYQLVRRLQSALFGGVYEAKGLSSGKDFAIKVLHKSELAKAEETSSIEFCEVPLNEVRFSEYMKGCEHVMDTEEHFDDQYCFYVVFELAKGGDLLEALKQKPTGFDEPHAQYLIGQATKGLAYLHRRRVGMQDVSLENMLLGVKEETGHYNVKVCDPGQAVVFDVDKNGEELPVEFHGLVGKSFRPPELHEQTPYYASKVDSWCLGWSTFYLLTAQPLFMSANPTQKDPDWVLFQQADFATLFQQKSSLCSPTGLDFIFRLLHIEPKRRLSIQDALNHPWLNDPKIMPMLAPPELLPEKLKLASPHAVSSEFYEEPEAEEAPSPRARGPLSSLGSVGSRVSGGLGSASGRGSRAGLGAHSMTLGWGGRCGCSGHTSSNPNLAPNTPMLRAPRSPRTPAPRPDRRGPIVPGRTHVSTAHSPAPAAGGVQAQQPSNGTTGAGQYWPPGRTLSPPMRRPSPEKDTLRPLVPSRTISPDTDEHGRSWAFRSDSGTSGISRRMRGATATDTTTTEFVSKPVPGRPNHSASSTRLPTARSTRSPTRGQQKLSQTPSYNSITFPRSVSPPMAEQQRGVWIPPNSVPVRAGRANSRGLISRNSDVGFSWTQAPPLVSPRTSPGSLARNTSPIAARPVKSGFAWSPDPGLSPRSSSPLTACGHASNGHVPGHLPHTQKSNSGPSRWYAPS